MGYIEQNLMAGEKVIYRAKIHWIVFLWPVIFLLVALAVFANFGTSFGGLFILLAAVAGLSSFITYTTSEFGLTDKRVLVKIGLIRRHSVETLLAKVEGIGVDQSILGRMLGYGTVMVTGTGGTKELFHRIEAPFEFRKRVQEQITAVQEGKK